MINAQIAHGPDARAKSGRAVLGDRALQLCLEVRELLFTLVDPRQVPDVGHQPRPQDRGDNVGSVAKLGSGVNGRCPLATRSIRLRPCALPRVVEDHHHVTLERAGVEP